MPHDDDYYRTHYFSWIDIWAFIFCFPFIWKEKMFFSHVCETLNMLTSCPGCSFTPWWRFLPYSGLILNFDLLNAHKCKCKWSPIVLFSAIEHLEVKWVDLSIHQKSNLQQITDSLLQLTLIPATQSWRSAGYFNDSLSYTVYVWLLSCEWCCRDLSHLTTALFWLDKWKRQ